MSTKIRYLVDLLHGTFSNSLTESLALKTRFKIRKGKLTPEMFARLCVLYGKDLCESSLNRLHSRLLITEGIDISPQALDQRFNVNAVAFLRELFETLIDQHNESAKINPLLQNMLFTKIKIVDGTDIQLPKNLAGTYPGSGGDASKSALKIQLEYELLQGIFSVCQPNSGTTSDSAYLPHNEAMIEKGELHLKDLGYYKVTHFKKIESEGAFYISKIKRTTTAYVKNPNPEFKKDGTIDKRKEYIKIDIQQLTHPLLEGQGVEFLDIYIGLAKLKARLIITKLSEESKRSRETKDKKNIRKRNKVKQDYDTVWASINTYITNIPPEMADANQIHLLYTLRWQIENMFKIWKSTFKIAAVKKVKLERFQCFLYGRLIELVLAASVVSTSKAIAMLKGLKPLSEKKIFDVTKEFLEHLTGANCKNKKMLLKFLTRLIQIILKRGGKNEKKGSISYADIFKFLGYNPGIGGDIII